jgi:hypothetical protein
MAESTATTTFTPGDLDVMERRRGQGLWDYTSNELDAFPDLDASDKVGQLLLRQNRLSNIPAQIGYVRTYVLRASPAD